MRLLWFNLATDLDDPILGFTTSWIRAMAKRVDFIYVITMRAGRVEVPENVKVYSVGKEKGYSELRRAMEFCRHLFHVLQKDRIDVCFSHMIPIFTVLAAPLLKAKGIPIVTWYAHPTLDWTLRLAHHLSDKMVASVFTAYPYKHDKLVVIGQGIDTEHFAPDGTPPENPPIILCVGRLSPVKDHSTLLKAAALLRQKGWKQFKVIIIGAPARPQDKAYVRSLQQQVEAFGLKDIVQFIGPVPNVKLPTWYRRCTVHVNLTPTGFGDKVGWEAMACAKPCLVANEGFQETLGEYANTLLFRYKDAFDLALKLELMLSLSISERARIGQYLRERVVQMHSLERLVNRLVNVFGETRQNKPKG